MIWYIIIALLVLFILWMLLVPVAVRIDTEYRLYAVTLPGIFNVYTVPSEGLFFIRIWVFFIPFKLDPFRMKRKKKKKEVSEKPKKKKRSFFGRPGNVKRVRKMTRAVKIRRLEADIDTDDFPLNAWLIPVFAAVNSYDNINMRINFAGNLQLRMDVRTRIGHMLWLFITNR
jgi:hypothetical protein